MATNQTFEIFIVTAPGLETSLAGEVRERGFDGPRVGAGGVAITGGWPQVWRANLQLRGAARVLARIASFRVQHLAQLDKRARRIEWGSFLRPDVAFCVEAACSRSRIYHSGAAAERFARAISDTLGAPLAAEAEVCVKVRIENDLCVVSLDTTGEPLHRRGHKQAVAKAPMRENLAALFLRQCGYAGTESVADPMCGSGTFLIEAADIAAGLHPGRSRAFAFEQLATFDAAAWQNLRAAGPPPRPPIRFYGSDRDAGAVEMSRANAERAGHAAVIEFAQRDIDEATSPQGPPGLVITNPPYGARIGDRQHLGHLYRRLGSRLRSNFSGWRVGLVTSEPDLARATGLPFAPAVGPVAHGGLRIYLFRTGPLP